MRSINDRLNDAVVAFAELAKLDPEHWRDKEELDALSRSRDLDPSGITTFMMLRGRMDALLEKTTFTARAILTDPDAFTTSVARLRSVKETIEQPDVVAIGADFRERLEDALVAAGANPEKLAASLEDAGSLGQVRYDALDSMERLEAHQFSYGAPESDRLRLNTTIFEFWNVNSLLALLRLQPLAGVTLCLIRDPAHVYASFFVIAIRNGETMTLLTDRQKTAHPLFWERTRRPERSLARRWGEHHFPYGLLDIRELQDENGDPDGFTIDSRTALVPRQQELIPIGKIADLEAHEILWLVMLFGKIAERYGAGNHEIGALSYTGEMLVNPNALLAEGDERHTALVPLGAYEPLSLPPLGAADLDAPETEEQWRREPSKLNQWMVEAYGDEVPTEALNVVGEAARLALEEKFEQKLLPSPAELERPFGWTAKRHELTHMPPTAFGTVEALDADRRFLARENQARIIKLAAERDFAAKKAETIAWYRDHVLAGRDALIEAAARAELELPHLKFWGFEGLDTKPMNEQRIHGVSNALRLLVAGKDVDEGRQFHRAHRWGMSGVTVGDYNERARFYYRCAVEPERGASVFALIQPTCPEALAALAGVTVDDLPLGLRHWYSTMPYRGNSILDRIDPIDDLKNPWHELRLTVLVCLSRHAFDATRRRLGLPRYAPGTQSK